MRSCAALLSSVGLLAALAGGCATEPPPVENLQPIPGVTGYPIAQYLLYAGGRRARDYAGAVDIRPLGVYEAPLDGRVRTVVHIAAQLDDASRQPLALDLPSTRLTVATTTERTLRALPPARVDGSLTAPAHGRRRIDLFFALPKEVTPHEVAGLRLSWMIQLGADAYMTTTPIAQRYTTGDNAVSLYVVPGFDPLLRPVEKRLVLPRPQAYRKSVVF